MPSKPRPGLRCHNPYVPNEVWDIFKSDLRKIVKMAFPGQKLSITEFYWQGFSIAEEYIQVTPKDSTPVDWKKVWSVLDFVAHEFGMAITFTYQKKPFFKAHSTETLFDREVGYYSLKNIRTWTSHELDDFIATHSFEALKVKYNEIQF